MTKIDVRDPAVSIGSAPDHFDGIDLTMNRSVESSRVRHVVELVGHYDLLARVVDWSEARAAAA